MAVRFRPFEFFFLKSKGPEAESTIDSLRILCNIFACTRFATTFINRVEINSKLMNGSKDIKFV